VVVLLLYARAFGIGIQMDSWVFASGVAASVGLALWGPVNEMVRSRFVRQVAETGEDSARTSATSLLVFTSSASVLVCVALFMGAPQIVSTLYAASEPSASTLVLKLFVLMLPSIVIGQVLNLGTAYMNCYDVIYAPEFMGVATAFLNLACVLGLTQLLGIYSLVFGYYLGATLSLVVVLRFLRSRGFLRGTGGAGAILRDARAAILFAAPLFFSYGAGQLNGLLEKYLASLMGVGVMSSVNYASQIKSALQAVLTSVMFSLIVPRLTHAASQWGGGEFKRMFAESQRVAMIFVLIVLPFVFGAADAIATILFGNRMTAPSALREIALLIRLYVAALVPGVLYIVYGVALLAQQKGRAYAALGMAAQLLSALICVALFQTFGPSVFPIALL
ncbi:MAG: lipid II flippase MurJ, partial [Longimicrobiales bacterium]